MLGNLKGKIYSINISAERGTVKEPVKTAVIGKEGIIGDSHCGFSLRHVSIINKERIDEFAKEAGRLIYPGEFAENITTIGLKLETAKIGSRFKIGNAELEVIQIGKDEKVPKNKIFRIIGKVVMVHEGLFCRVISPGKIAEGEEIILIS